VKVKINGTPVSAVESRPGLSEFLLHSVYFVSSSSAAAKAPYAPASKSTKRINSAAVLPQEVDRRAQRNPSRLVHRKTIRARAQAGKAMLRQLASTANSRLRR